MPSWSSISKPGLQLNGLMMSAPPHCTPPLSHLVPLLLSGLLTQVPVVFELGKHCTFGHSFAIVGETPELGEWDTTKAARMEVRTLLR